MAIDEARAEKALLFLEHTDAQYADTRVMMLRAEYLVDVTECMVYKTLEGSIEDRKRLAKSDTATQAKFDDYLKSVRDYEFLRARRRRAELTLEMWRSLNANRRQGGAI